MKTPTRCDQYWHTHELACVRPPDHKGECHFAFDADPDAYLVAGAAIAARDAEHAASSSVAWEALERVSDMLQGAENPYDFNSGHWHLWNDRRKRELSVARAALALRPGGKP